MGWRYFEGKRAELLVEDFADLSTGGRTIIDDGRDFGRQRLEPAPSGRFRPGPHRHPGGHAIKPGPDRVARAEVARPADEDQERRLKRVFDVRLVGQHAPADAQDHRPMPRHQRLERDLVAASR